MNRPSAYLTLAACVLLVALVAYITIDSIIGNFGDGPPYYGRTTNMDKWEDPVPTLLAINILVAAVVLPIGYWAARTLLRSTGKPAEKPGIDHD